MDREQYSNYIVYVDESGDHGMENISSGYPIFVLAFCIFNKQSYYREIIPSLMELKTSFWGHGEVVLHEHDIRKPKDDFTILFNRKIREIFMEKLNKFIGETTCTLTASVINKLKFRDHYSFPANPYEMSMSFGLERIYRFLKDNGQHDKCCCEKRLKQLVRKNVPSAPPSQISDPKDLPFFRI